MVHFQLFIVYYLRGHDWVNLSDTTTELFHTFWCSILTIINTTCQSCHSKLNTISVLVGSRERRAVVSTAGRSPPKSKPKVHLTTCIHFQIRIPIPACVQPRKGQFFMTTEIDGSFYSFCSYLANDVSAWCATASSDTCTCTRYMLYMYCLSCVQCVCSAWPARSA